MGVKVCLVSFYQLNVGVLLDTTQHWNIRVVPIFTKENPSKNFSNSFCALIVSLLLFHNCIFVTPGAVPMTTSGRDMSASRPGA